MAIWPTNRGLVSLVTSDIYKRETCANVQFIVTEVLVQ